MRQYGRDDVDYGTWYSKWMKDLAAAHSVEELQRMLAGTASEGQRHASAHLRAIQRTGSMQGASQARAQSRNTVSATGEKACAIRGAIEIHDLFPEHAKAPTA